MFGSKEAKKTLQFTVCCGSLLGINLHICREVPEALCLAVFFQGLGFQGLGRGPYIKSLFFCVFSDSGVCLDDNLCCRTLNPKLLVARANVRQHGLFVIRAFCFCGPVA